MPRAVETLGYPRIRLPCDPAAFAVRIRTPDTQDAMPRQRVYWPFVRLESLIMQRIVVAGSLTLLMVNGASATGGQAAETDRLYVCTDTASAPVPDLGVTVCDATTTPELERRAEADNLQSRQGALVVSLQDAGVSARAGLQPGDVIYRVGGVDVASAESATDVLALIDARSDTIVNFLRGGRPYRVKIRRD